MKRTKIKRKEAGVTKVNYYFATCLKCALNYAVLIIKEVLHQSVYSTDNSVTTTVLKKVCFTITLQKFDFEISKVVRR